MNSRLNERIKIKPWEWIPFFGTFAWIFRISLWLGFQAKVFRKKVNLFRNIFNGIIFLVTLSMMILFILNRNGQVGSQFQKNNFIFLIAGLS
ncbi:MAG: hypothetical protein K4H23_05060, partial [Mollicutes bacterium PWAP]|nr:hypothetical protein [Mollicutes bacterium PWAP]